MGTMGAQRFDIFISYRRLDSSIFSEMLAAQLQTAYGRNRVFIDTKNIRDADVWRSQVEGALLQAKVVIVVIGKDWLSIFDEYDRRLIDLPTDWVRREIETSLTGEKKILPVFIDDAQIPAKNALPSSIAKLVDFQAHRIGTKTGNITKDMAGLVSQIGMLLNTRPNTNEISYPFPSLKIDPLDEDNLGRVEARLPEWRVVSQPCPVTSRCPDGVGLALRRTFEFESFLDAIHFMNTASRFIELKRHHPEWTNVWQTLIVHLTTWDIGHKPSMLDVDVATYLDRLYDDYRKKISQQDVLIQRKPQGTARGPNPKKPSKPVLKERKELRARIVTKRQPRSFD